MGRISERGLCYLPVCEIWKPLDHERQCFDGLKVVKIPAISSTSMSVKVCANSRRDGVHEGF